MPTSLHEGLLLLLRNRPRMPVELLGGVVLGAELPATFHAQVEDATLTETAPSELHADLLIVVRDEALVPTLAIVIEVQLQPDARKSFSWPRYLVAARSRHRCPALLLVVTPLEAVATWARAPLQLGPGSVVRPVVLGPRQIPQVTDFEVARAAPELALLSLLASRGAKLERRLAIATAAERAIAELPEEQAKLYFDVGRAGIGDALRKALEERMSATGYRYQSEFARRYVAEGREEGREEGLEAGREEVLRTARDFARRLLSGQFGPLPPEAVARLGVADVATLERWVEAAPGAHSLEELLAR